MKSSKIKAFTLIELLVVIAIIAILAAILFPVFAQAKAAAKNAASISNIKQVALGGLMYSNDNDDVFNPAYNGDQSAWETPSLIGSMTSGGVYYKEYFSNWCDIMQPYLKSGAVTFATEAQHEGTGVLDDPGTSEASLDASTCQPGYGQYGYRTSGYFTMNANFAYSITGFGKEMSFQDWLDSPTGGPSSGTVTWHCPDSASSSAQGESGVNGSATNPCMQPPGEWSGLMPYIGRSLAWPDTTQTSVARPDQTIIANNGFTITQQGGGWGSGITWGNDGYPCSGDKVHSGGGNYAFVDGHSKKITGDPRHYITEYTTTSNTYYMTYLDMAR